MRIKFSQPNTKAVTFSRGGESITLTVHALPLGYRDHAQNVLAYKAKSFTNSQPDPETEEQAAERTARYSYLLIAKGLEPENLWETNTPPANVPLSAWGTYADAIRGELADAGFTEGEVLHLLEVVTELETSSISSAETAAGNSDAPTGA